MRIDGIVDLLRCLSFVAIIYFVTVNSFAFFPLPFVWVFEDFSKFIFEPQCVAVFIDYIKLKEPQKLNSIYRLMRLFVGEFDKVRLSETSGSAKFSVTAEASPTIVFPIGR